MTSATFSASDAYTVFWDEAGSSADGAGGVAATRGDVVTGDVVGAGLGVGDEVGDGVGLGLG
ncbi:MAG TPA: hypothetical protein VE567_08050, partial [Sphingomonas sp.]|nr:hypothetical protein [Sphingomonas sp.]